MTDRVIDNPIINAPYAEPTRHFAFADDGITDEVVAGRRPSAYFVPIPASTRRQKQAELPTEWTLDRLKPCDQVNLVRARLDLWRKKGRPHLTPTSRTLLDHWTAPGRDKPLFFCQVEAAETAIWLTEAAVKEGDS